VTTILPTLALALLIWLALGVLVAGLFHLALGPRRAEKRYRRWER
jgi:hypothetical protein